MANPIDELIHFIQQSYRKRQWIKTVIYGLAVACLGATLFAVTGYVMWGGFRSVVVGFVFGLILVVFVVVRRPRPMSRLDAARLADSQFGLQDRLATAVEWQDKDAILVPRLLEDASHHARQVRGMPALAPLKLFSREHLSYGIMLVLSVLLWSLPFPQGSPPLRPNLQPETWSDLTHDPFAMTLEALQAEADHLTPIERELFDRDLADIERGIAVGSIPRSEIDSLLRYLEDMIQDGLPQERLDDFSEWDGDMAGGDPDNWINPEDDLQADADDATDGSPMSERERVQSGDDRSVESGEETPDQPGGAPIGGAVEGEDEAQFESGRQTEAGSHPGDDSQQEGFESQGQFVPHLLSGVPRDRDSSDAPARPGIDSLSASPEEGTGGLSAVLAEEQLPVTTPSTSDSLTEESRTATGDAFGIHAQGVMRDHIPLAHRSLIIRYFTELER